MVKEGIYKQAKTFTIQYKKLHGHIILSLIATCPLCQHLLTVNIKYLHLKETHLLSKSGRLSNNVLFIIIVFAFGNKSE